MCQMWEVPCRVVQEGQEGREGGDDGGWIGSRRGRDQ